MEQANTKGRVTIFDGLNRRPAANAGMAGFSPAALAERNAQSAPIDGETLSQRAMLLLRRRPLIEAAIEAIRPTLQRDGGDCELIRIKDDAVYLKLSGACVDCQLAAMTVGGVKQKIIEAVGFPLRVIPVS